MNKKFYLKTLALLAVVSAYPVFNGLRMLYLSWKQGPLEPGQYTKYVIPYAAIGLAVLLFALIQPWLQKIKRFALATGLALAYSIFFVIERLLEGLQISVKGLTLIDVATMQPGGYYPYSTVDIYQAMLCYVGPSSESIAIGSSTFGKLYYVMGDSGFKVHYYMISLLLITMVCCLLYDIAKMQHNENYEKKKALAIRIVATAALIALCIFANTTAFFRQATAIQTPLASLLTALFFIVLGVAVGLYSGSYLLDKTELWSLYLPAFLALLAVVLMYIGEAAMMNGNLYRFGSGWFFARLPMTSLALVDVLIILFTTALCFFSLKQLRQERHKFSSRPFAVALVTCFLIAAIGPTIVLANYRKSEVEISGCYKFLKLIYINPLSSMIPNESSTLVYGFSEDKLIIGDTETGIIALYGLEYYKTQIKGKEAFDQLKLSEISIATVPDLNSYKACYLYAVASDALGIEQFGLYLMDNEIWLVEIRSSYVWSIIRLDKTTTTSFSDLQSALSHYQINPFARKDDGSWENQMTIHDVYTLARIGKELNVADFAGFPYHLCGSDFKVRCYPVDSGALLYLYGADKSPDYALLKSPKAVSNNQTVDLKEGLAAVAFYLNPLASFLDITIKDPQGGDIEPEFLFTDTYDQTKYFLDSKRADQVIVVLSDGEEMPIKQALKERWITIEDAVAHGLNGVIIEPYYNKIGGRFLMINQEFEFWLNNEIFYPSKTFICTVKQQGKIFNYIDSQELLQVMSNYGYKDKVEQISYQWRTLLATQILNRQFVDKAELAKRGIKLEITWSENKKTLVQFSFGD